MIDFGPKDVYFLGRSKTIPSWYRSILPALNLGADWNRMPGSNPYNHLIVVYQQPDSKDDFELIKELQSQGTKVIYETDDDLHAAAEHKSFINSKSFTRERLGWIEDCMALCDGMIVSTEALKERYRDQNLNKIFVCPNGIDTKRYDLDHPEKDVFTIGWAGGSGHTEALHEWLPAVEAIMEENDNVGLMLYGGDAGTGRPTKRRFPDRVLHIPFGTIENYPAMLTAFDVSLAPSLDTGWYRAKSDLRWLEASAVGIPSIVGGPTYKNLPKVSYQYNPEEDRFEDAYCMNIEGRPDRQTAWEVWKRNGSELEGVYYALDWIVNNPQVGNCIGKVAKKYVQENRDISITINSWIKALEGILD